MRKRIVTSMALACALAFSCLAAPAIAAPQAGVDGEGLDIGGLSDRYESLNKLGSSLTDEESVVIATRIGVLVSTNRALNDSEVSFTGEAVGDVVTAGAGSKWANLMGTSNAVISVFLSDEQAALIQNVGDYHATGTTLKVTGTYHIACPEHEGELDVHAASVEVVDAGGPVVHMVAPGRLETAIALCGVAALLLAAFLITRSILRKRAES